MLCVYNRNGCCVRVRKLVAGYGRAMFAPVRLGPHCNGGLDVQHQRSVRESFWAMQ